MELYEKLLIFSLIKSVFSAFNVGFRVASSVTFRGFTIRFSGYNKKIQLLIEMISKVLKRLSEDVTEEMFELQKTEIKKNLSNSILSAGRIESALASKILKSEHWTDFDKLNEIDKISFETLQKFLVKFYHQTKVQVLIQGNLLKAQANAIVEVLERELSSEPLETVSFLILFFHEFTSLLFRNTRLSLKATSYLWEPTCYE